MRIDSSGNLLVGQSLLGTNTVGHILLPNGSAYHIRDGGTAGIFNRKTSDGVIVGLQKDGTTVGSIGTHNLDLVIHGTASGHVGLRFGNAEFYPTNNAGALSDATVSIGSDSNRFKDAYLSGGVYLGGTAAANKLDDYEEGTWTPTLSCSTTNPTPTAVNITNADYTKIGNTVFIRAYIGVTLTDVGTGGAEIAGLPFTVKSGTYTPVTFAHGSLIHSNGGFFGSNSTHIVAIGNNSVGTVPFAGTGLRYLMISGQYQTDS